MKRRLYAPAVLLAGLLSAQIIATAHVYLSNLDLLQASEAILRSGYLMVPNTQVTARLDSPTTAMAGGVLFTLSIGAGLSLITLMAVWIWDRIFKRRRRAVLGALLIWAAALLLINDNGWNPIASIYLTVVPLVTSLAAIQLMPPRTILLSPTGVIWPVAAVILLAAMWTMVLDRDLFTNVRDNLLLNNRFGKAITNAYYAYTLFPAEAFKSLNQKQLRTCVLGDSLDHPDWDRLEKTFRTRDYLPIPAGQPVDLSAAQDRSTDGFVLQHGKENVLRISRQKLFASTTEVLATYSQRMDRNRTFRTLTLVCLVIGLPVVLFVFLFSVLGVLPNLFLTVSFSDGIAALLCVAAGIGLLIPVYQGRSASAAVNDPQAALASASLNMRIAALKQSYAKKQDIYPEVLKYSLNSSPHVAERYWVARNLAFTQNPQAGAILSRLLGDPIPIVACQALWAIGERKDPTMVATIIDRINTSPHWYVQMYAYRALRNLGWVQPRSPQLSY